MKALVILFNLLIPLRPLVSVNNIRTLIYIKMFILASDIILLNNLNSDVMMSIIFPVSNSVFTPYQKIVFITDLVSKTYYSMLKKDDIDYNGAIQEISKDFTIKVVNKDSQIVVFDYKSNKKNYPSGKLSATRR